MIKVIKVIPEITEDDLRAFKPSPKRITFTRTPDSFGLKPGKDGKQLTVQLSLHLTLTSW